MSEPLSKTDVARLAASLFDLSFTEAEEMLELALAGELRELEREALRIQRGTYRKFVRPGALEVYVEELRAAGVPNTTIDQLVDGVLEVITEESDGQQLRQ